MISTSKWKFGENIPSIRKIAETLKVSKSTIINCIRKLIEQGLLESNKSLGFIVCKSNVNERITVNKQSQILQLASLNLRLASTIYKGSTVVDNYIVVIDKKNLIVHITNIETRRTFDRRVKDLIDIVVNPIKLSVLLKANGSKFIELRRKFDEQIKLSNVAKYVYKEIQ